MHPGEPGDADVAVGGRRDRAPSIVTTTISAIEYSSVKAKE